MKHYHSVELIGSKCIGCTDCIKRCPTEAIRVRNGKAVIIDDRCIDCGMCIRVCRNRAKVALTQPLKILSEYKYKIAVPAPTLYSQFKHINDVNMILTGIKKLGFDDVFEVARAAEVITAKTTEYLHSHDYKKPVLSSACPVIMRLISQRFPSLLGNILPLISPMEAAAIAARKYAIEKGIDNKDIGVFFISPCSAKATYIINPLGIEKSEIDGVISIQYILIPLQAAMKQLDHVEPLCQSLNFGMDWAISGGESNHIEIDNAIAVDGMENVIKVLEQVEDGQIDVDYIEALACAGGCLGGPLAPLNAFVAKNNLAHVRKNTSLKTVEETRDIPTYEDEINFAFEKDISQVPVMKLDDNMEIAISKMEWISEIYAKLPKIDCGSCGAPTCHALAEDIVRGTANMEDCIFMLRKKVKDLAELMVDLTKKMPQTMSDNEQEQK